MVSCGAGLCLACEVSVTLLLWAAWLEFVSQTFAVLEGNASLQLVCFSNSVQHGNTLCQILLAFLLRFFAVLTAFSTPPLI